MLLRSTIFAPYERTVDVLEVIHALTDDQVTQVRDLSRGYIAYLTEHEKELGVYDPEYFQAYGYINGVAQLPGEFAPPDGCLLLALYDALPAGCVGLVKSSDNTCEIRMLFVPVAFQGKGVGKALVNSVIDSAQKIGYDAIRLETANYMTDAHRLYRALGFHEIKPYYDVQHAMKAIVTFMEKSLV